MYSRIGLSPCPWTEADCRAAGACVRVAHVMIASTADRRANPSGRRNIFETPMCIALGKKRLPYSSRVPKPFKMNSMKQTSFWEDVSCAPRVFGQKLLQHRQGATGAHF